MPRENMNRLFESGGEAYREEMTICGEDRIHIGD